MKVLHVTGAKIWGGNEQQLFNLVTNLNKNDLENYVFGVEDSKIKKAFEDYDIHFECAEHPKLKFFKNTTSFKNFIKKIKPDVIHLKLLYKRYNNFLLGFLNQISLKLT